jgi:hypothetical protein
MQSANYTTSPPTGITLCAAKRIINLIMKSAGLNKNQYNVVGENIYTLFRNSLARIFPKAIRVSPLGVNVSCQKLM